MKPRLAALDGPLQGQTIELSAEPLTIGRGPDNRLSTSDPSASRQHCEIVCESGVFRVRDLGSHNGTFVNRVPVRERVLAEGDEIKVGRSVFRLLLSEEASTSSPEAVRFDEAAIDGRTVVLRPYLESVYWKPGEALATPGAGSDAPGYRALLRVAAALLESNSVDDLVDRLLGTLGGAVKAGRGAAFVFGPRGEEIAVRTWTRGGGENAVGVSRAAVDRVFAEGVALLSGGETIVAAPLASRERTLGVIYLESREGPKFDENDLQLVAAAGVITGPALQTALEIGRLQMANRLFEEEIRARHEMVGESASMQELYRAIARTASAASTVLISGETGTGKELVARAIHQSGSRARRPFVAINSAALTESLLESELFGHERGAFTGAVALKKGKLEAADGGTLFLDEIGELPLNLQSRLLRVLQEREFERVGGTRTIQVDIRLIAATNRNLREEVEQGGFRQDLFYRLNVVTLRLPPLRERPEDIMLLANYFLARCANRSERRIAGFSDVALACLSGYDWPGNVRELQNAIESAVVLGTGELIEPEDLPDAVVESAPPPGLAPGSYQGSVRRQKSEIIIAAVTSASGNITEAAKMLNLHPNYLHRLIRQLGLRDRIRRPESIAERSRD